MAFRDPTRDRQPEAGAGRRRACRIKPDETLEDPLAVGRRDSWSRVVHRDRRELVMLRDPDGDGAAGRRVLQRIVEKVRHETAKQPVVRVDRDIGLQFRDEPDVLCDRNNRRASDALLDDIVDVKRPPRDWVVRLRRPSRARACHRPHG